MVKGEGKAAERRSKLLASHLACSHPAQLNLPCVADSSPQARLL